MTPLRVGRHSLRVNQKYRITFLWGEGGHADDVICEDYH
jgi:plasmid maintenance system killer protein